MSVSMNAALRHTRKAAWRKRLSRQQTRSPGQIYNNVYGQAACPCLSGRHVREPHKDGQMKRFTPELPARSMYVATPPTVTP